MAHCKVVGSKGGKKGGKGGREEGRDEDDLMDK